MKTFRLGCLVLLVGCGGAEFTAPDDGGGQGGGSSGGGGSVSSSTSTSSTSTSTSMSTSVTTGPPTGGDGGSGSTTTATGSGGGRPDGGPGGSGGQSFDAGRDAPVSCDATAPTPVTFHMSSMSGTDYCLNTCGSPWVSIIPIGSSTPLVVARSCTTTCGQCQPIACGAACIPPQHIKPGGETYTWDGTLWEQGRCGPQMFSCVNQVCSVPPGKYTARMCANRATGDAGGFCASETTPTCVDVPFDYPATTDVVGVLK